MVEASAKSGHPTFVLVREATLSNASKSELIDSFRSLGVTFLYVYSILRSFLISTSSVPKLLSMLNYYRKLSGTCVNLLEKQYKFLVTMSTLIMIKQNAEI